jgi:hypothetical protein
MNRLELKNKEIRQETGSTSMDTATRIRGLRNIVRKLKFIKRFRGGVFGVCTGLLMVMVAGALIFYGCKKENTATQDETSVKQQKLSQKWKNILAADAGGAGIGAILGSSGGPIGTVGGAIISGVGASILQARIEKNKEKEAGTVEEEEVSLPSIDESSAGNNNNPYDYIGKVHYQLMNDFLVNLQFYCTDDGEFSLYIYYQNVADMLPNYVEELSEEVITNFSIENLSQCIEMSSNEIETIFSAMEMEMNINSQLRTILVSYENYSKTCPNFEDFYDYSVLKEQEVLDNTIFTDLEKQIALSYMATFRWGYWYWDNVIF